MRVRAHLEHQPRLPFHGDYDYFSRLRELRPVLEALQRGGRCIPLLLEKATHGLLYGNFPETRDAANSALQLNNSLLEAHWLRAMAFIGLCLNRLGVLGLSPAILKHDVPQEPAMEYLEEARGSLERCVELSDGRDQEAVDLLDYLTALGDAPREALLREKLRPLLA